MSDLDGDDLLSALDEARAADFLVEVDSGAGESFSFSHALVRRALLGRPARTGGGSTRASPRCSRPRGAMRR